LYWITFINDKKKEIMNIIENNPKWGDSSKMSYYYMISRYLDIKNNEDPLIKIYENIGGIPNVIDPSYFI